MYVRNELTRTPNVRAPVLNACTNRYSDEDKQLKSFTVRARVSVCYW
jgi:hypothetical protein